MSKKANIATNGNHHKAYCQPFPYLCHIDLMWYELHFYLASEY